MSTESAKPSQIEINRDQFSCKITTGLGTSPVAVAMGVCVVMFVIGIARIMVMVVV